MCVCAHTYKEFKFYSGENAQITIYDMYACLDTYIHYVRSSFYRGGPVQGQMMDATMQLLFSGLIDVLPKLCLSELKTALLIWSDQDRGEQGHPLPIPRY